MHDDQSAQYWRQRALNAEQENTMLREQIEGIPERIKNVLSITLDGMINGQILKAKKVNINGTDYEAKERRYENGQIKLVLVDKEGNDYLEVSQNDGKTTLDYREIIILKEHYNITEILQRNKVLNYQIKDLDEKRSIVRVNL